MRFGDTLVRQLVEITMGMSPAPSLANLYVALYEERCVLKFLKDCVFYLCRFVDDSLCIWLHHPDPKVDADNWSRFKAAVTSGGLDWTFTKRAKSVEFMDMTIKLAESKIETTLYEKPMALHLYIPPHSCHAPGVSTSTVMGKVLRIFQLCTHKKDIDEKLVTFFGQLLDRGYQMKPLKALFQRAITSAESYIREPAALRQKLASKKEAASRRQVYLHLPYHPCNPPAREIQHLWRQFVFKPPNGTQLNHLNTFGGAPIPVDRLILAYSRAPNLGNLLSYTKICKCPGPKVSPLWD